VPGILTPPTPEQAKRMADALDESWRVNARYDPEFAAVQKYYAALIRKGAATASLPTPTDASAPVSQPHREDEAMDASPVDRLRQVVDCAEAGQHLQPPVAAWLAQGARAYLRDAPGVRLDAALGLHPAWGESGWWTTGPREERDAVLAEMDRQLFGQLDIPTAARSIVALARRRQERGAVDANEVALLAKLAMTGRNVPGEKQIRNILRRARSQDERGHDRSAGIEPTGGIRYPTRSLR
jgi:hypothetical protein